ncbi:MAG: HAD family phosphatase [Lachnospiraceae bacterium]|nr:HAD family phosphatase [Lachnospiraceae bacterium]
MIKNIVFDMGNVLTKYTLDECIRRYADTEEVFQMIKKEVVGSKEWLAMDRGTMGDEEAIASICKRLPLELHEVVKRFVQEFRMQPEENPSMEGLISRLKETGYRIYLFSNTASRFHRFSKNIPSLSYMDGFWLSCEHGYLKPEKEAYESFFAKFGLKPTECLFIDDTPANIEAGIKLGMRGIVYCGAVEELKWELEKLLEKEL